jgi:predicted dienelactone hydrolase
MNNLINLARYIPAPEANLTVAYTPILLPMDGRQPLELRLTAPAIGENLPIVLLSHGFGPSNYIPSKDGYAPLAQFWVDFSTLTRAPTTDIVVGTEQPILRCRKGPQNKRRFNQ